MSINKFSPNTEKYGPEKIRVVFFSSSVRPHLLNTLLSNPKYLTSFSFEKCFDHVPQEISFIFRGSKQMRQCILEPFKNSKSRFELFEGSLS